MSLAMLSSVGLVPVSQAVTSGMLKLSLTGLFFGAGILILLASARLAFQPDLKSIHVLIRKDEA